MKTIRIDSEVWTWLQGQAVPLVDSPNAVLRRLAGLEVRGDGLPPDQGKREGEETEPSVSVHRFSGKELIRLHRLPVRQARYHRGGTFFEILNEFPGALCDSKGYVIYQSQSEFDGDQEISIGAKVNVHQQVRNHSRYRTFVKRPLRRRSTKGA